MDKTLKRIGKLGLFIAVALCLSVPMAILLSLPSHRVIHQWHQSADINYNNFDPYTLAVVEGARDWATLGWPRRHYIFVGRSNDVPDSGHYLAYTFHPDNGNKEHIKKSLVEWDEDGVTFIEATGHKLFIPKKMFIGGR
ncbi:hypothetical protein ES703_17214 [subsurface metagenome]